jgi:hypothetical protein
MTDPQHAEPAAAPVRPRLERWVWILWAGFAVFAVVASWALIYAVQARHAEQRQASGKAAAVQAVSTANSRLSAAGLPTVSAPSAAPMPTVTVTETKTGSPGPAGPGPSSAQIQLAVNAYCLATHCGSGPTAAQVAQAVAMYCNRDGQCRGAAGESGAPGASGTPGQNATAEQVADAVTTYCAAHEQCAGPPGPTGAPGADGASGAPGEPPYSWSYTDPLGVEHTCSRASPFDPTAPTYSCD